MFKLSNRPRYYALFLEKRGNSFSVIRKKRFNRLKASVRYKKETYEIDVSDPITKGLKLYYFLEKGKTQVHLNSPNLKSSVNPRIIDMIIGQRIVEQFASSLDVNKAKFGLMSIIIGCLIGFPIGFIIAGYV